MTRGQAAAVELDALRPENRQDPAVRARFSGPAMRAFLNIAERWKLSVDERRGLLGWPSASAYHKYRNGDIPRLSFDALTRISLVLGIFKDLHILFPDAAIADAWVKLPNSNPVFAGQKPIEFMTRGGLDSMHSVRRLLDGRRGGWS